MFFDIAKQPNHILPLTEQINDWYFSHDLGWESTTNNTWYKGYHTSKNRGNWCEIRFKNNTLTIDTPDHRTFPIWYNNNQLSNFVQLEHTAYNYNQVSHNGTNIVLNWDYPAWLKILETPQKKLLNKTQVRDQIINHIISEINDINDSFDLPYVMAKTRGVDSTVIRAVMDYMSIKYELCDKVHPIHPFHEHVYNNHNKIFWGYKQIGNNTKPHIQVTGFCGDEYLQRNPMYVHWYLKEYNIDVVKLFENYDHSYAKKYYEQNFKENIKKFNDIKNPRQHLINHLTNDFQMWHINQCITFTPFCSKEILEISLNMDPNVVASQVVHADIHKSIIKKLNPKLLDIISADKV